MLLNHTRSTKLRTLGEIVVVVSFKIVDLITFYLNLTYQKILLPKTPSGRPLLNYHALSENLPESMIFFAVSHLEGVF